ncbi:hypothetical protein BU16DRAFT_527258 [Lophium mytilinum]|uniref:Uncharacterized protein n=1 Tax=Lophium mytilinum TaxID=390894 RepID=A0A6A6QTF6_9PEZI|nr:hypothetical protein BU16DRAFT_527258 [Lophium mytilinum]
MSGQADFHIDGLVLKDDPAADDDTEDRKMKTKIEFTRPGLFNLEGVPGDILDVIAHDYLESFDFFTLRGTSRTLRDCTSKAFGRRYFMHVKFMLSPHSLQALSDISHTPLAKFIRHITIGTERLQSDIREAMFIHANRNISPEWDRKYGQKYLIELRRQERMEEDGGSVDVLAAAFSCLPNLESVGIGGPRNVSHVANVQSWGTERLIRELGAIEMLNDYEYVDTPERYMLLHDKATEYRAFEVVFKVLGEMKTRDLKLDLFISRPEERQNIPFPLNDSNVRECLRSVRSLELYRETPWLVEWAGRLFQQTSPTFLHLHGISIRFDDFNLISNFCNESHAPLQSLKLSRIIKVKVDMLSAMLTQVVPTLETLNLDTVWLARGQQIPTPRHETWAKVFEVLRGMPKLRKLSLADLIEERIVGEDGADATSVAEETRWVFKVALHLRGRERIAHVLGEAINDDSYQCLSPYGLTVRKRFRW